MKLTFKGFLKDYCKALAGVDTVSVKKLCSLAATDAPRVAEPLFLSAVENGSMDLLMKYSKGTWMEEEYSLLAVEARSYLGLAEVYLARCNVPSRYSKVLDVYNERKGAIGNDRRVVGLMREKTVAALESKGITGYRVCKDLGLNLGNVYAYLSKGDVTKVSRQTARKIFDYATA